MIQFPLICKSLKSCKHHVCQELSWTLAPIGFEFLNYKARTFLVVSDHVLARYDEGHCGRLVRLGLWINNCALMVVSKEALHVNLTWLCECFCDQMTQRGTFQVYKHHSERHSQDPGVRGEAGPQDSRVTKGREAVRVGPASCWRTRDPFLQLNPKVVRGKL